MKAPVLFLNLGILCMALFLSGCFHGETFSEWKNQHFADNPDEFSAIAPNDTQEDPVCRKFLSKISSDLENRGKFKRKVKSR